MGREYPQDFAEVIRFHGHVCPGLAIGYRAALAARSHLGAQRSQDEELVAIVETDACSVDAIQVELGCTLGKGNLIYRDLGKHVFTVVSREEGKAVRISMRGDALQPNPEQEALLQRVRSGGATEEEQRAYDAFQQERIWELLHMDEDTLFRIDESAVEVPEKARIFKSVVCHYCGEKVMEPRARIRDGEIACMPCAKSYSRGW